MVTLVYVSLVIIVVYLIGMFFKAGKDIPESISSTYFTLSHKGIFGAVLIIASTLLLPRALEITPDYLEFLPFLGVLGMWIVAFFPDTTKEDQIKFHMIGGIGGCAIFNVWTAFLGAWYIKIMWGLLIVGSVWLCKTDNIVLRDKIILHIKNHIIFWVEIITLLGLYGTILIK